MGKMVTSKGMAVILGLRVDSRVCEIKYVKPWEIGTATLCGS
jgi:hypothetical protein